VPGGIVDAMVVLPVAVILPIFVVPLAKLPTLFDSSAVKTFVDGSVLNAHEGTVTVILNASPWQNTVGANVGALIEGGAVIVNVLLEGLVVIGLEPDIRIV